MEKRIFPTLIFNQPPIRRVQEVLSSKVKRPQRKANPLPQFNVEFQNTRCFKFASSISWWINICKDNFAFDHTFSADQLLRFNVEIQRLGNLLSLHHQWIIHLSQPWKLSNVNSHFCFTSFQNLRFTFVMYCIPFPSQFKLYNSVVVCIRDLTFQSIR